jgi:hypothetical protein
MRYVTPVMQAEWRALDDPEPKIDDRRWPSTPGIKKALRQLEADPALRDLKIGDRVPMPRRKLDIRPAFTGADKPSFKPARKGKK